MFFATDLLLLTEQGPDYFIDVFVNDLLLLMEQADYYYR